MSPLTSWLVIGAAILAVFALVVILGRLDARLDEWASRRRRVRRDLDDLARLERAREALRRNTQHRHREGNTNDR
jgi:hypothetical protein